MKNIEDREQSLNDLFKNILYIMRGTLIGYVKQYDENTVIFLRNKLSAFGMDVS